MAKVNLSSYMSQPPKGTSDGFQGTRCWGLVFLLFSSPEQGELIIYIPMLISCRLSVDTLFTISNCFSSETAWPVKAKFYVEPPWEGGTKVYIVYTVNLFPFFTAKYRLLPNPKKACIFPIFVIFFSS